MMMMIQACLQCKLLFVFWPHLVTKLRGVNLPIQVLFSSQTVPSTTKVMETNAGN